MSHVATISLEIKSLEDLAVAAERCGLTLALNQKTYKWWGRSVGNTPLPAGFTAEDLGKCDHALKQVDPAGRAWEIGVCRSPGSAGGFSLLWDNWNGGGGLVEKIGQNGEKLKQAYAITTAARVARLKGFATQEVKRQDGSIQLVCRRA